VVLLFGLVEFGLAMYSKGMITNASREGARFGVVYSSPRKTEPQIRDEVRNTWPMPDFRTMSTSTSPGLRGPVAPP